MTVQTLDDSTLTAHFIWKKLPPMSISILKTNFCRVSSVRENGCPASNKHMVLCHALEMPLFDYVFKREISPLPRAERNKHLKRLQRHSILRGEDPIQLDECSRKV